MPTDPKRVQSVFLAAADQATAAGRAAYLERACGADGELRLRVEALLRAHDDPASFLEKPRLELEAGPGMDPVPAASWEPGPMPDATASPRLTGEGPGSRIGPYKLLQQIGEGGMGTVFMAEQTKPVQRKVALKIIKPDMDRRQVIARFEAERQALALMDHPNIAKVLDAGTTETGRPYFVMELVKGVPITTFCDERRLPLRERLELCVAVCQAVQHAHQKGIIHRDLKPSNVLIALYDGKPAPKIIDFGVAKATGPKLTERTMFTEFGAIIGTLEYMSPEQAELNQLDVDTRSDIYSLGVLLYELLTGTTPLERNRLKDTSLLDALRLIREEEPPRPSYRLSTTQGLPTIAANRDLEPSKLCRLVKGELDWIVMKGLEKDRNHRYESAGSLARDIERYLRDEPVLACPPSAAYRLRKFARRNKAAVLAATVTLLCLVGGVIGTSWGLLRAVAERDQKHQAQKAAEANLRKTHQAVNDYFTLVSEDTLLYHPALEPLRRQLLQAALDHYHRFAQEHGDDPELQGELVATYFRIAQLNHDLHAEEDWLPAAQKCVAILEDLLRRKPDASSLASLQGGIRRFNSTTPFWVRDLAGTLRTMEKARDLWGILVREYPDIPGFRHDLASHCHVIGNLHSGAGRFDEAVRSYKYACGIWYGLDRNVVHHRAALAICLFDLGLALDGAGQLPQALEAGRRGLGASQELVTDFPDVALYQEFLALSHGGVAAKLVKTGQFQAAEEEYRKMLAIQERLSNAFPKIMRFRQRELPARESFAELLWALGRRMEAGEQYRRARGFAEKATTDDSRFQATLARFLASCPAEFRDVQRALELAKKVVQKEPQAGGYWSTLGLAHYGAGEYRAAVRAIEKGRQLDQAIDSESTFFLAMARSQLGEKGQARKLFTQAVRQMEKDKPSSLKTRRIRAEAAKVLGVRDDKK
jgi:serine/threonine protein kinase